MRLRLPCVALLSVAALFAQSSLDEAKQRRRDSSPQVAARAYEAALSDVRQGHDPTLLARTLLEYAQTQLAAGDYAASLRAAKESANLFLSLGDKANQAAASNTAASAQLYNGDYTSALSSFEYALRLDRETGDGKGEITRLSNVGNVYFFQGKYLDALKNYEQALDRVNQTASQPWNPGRRELVLNNLATLYEQLGQNGKALEFYQQALAGSSQMAASERAQLLSNVGTLYRRLGDAVKALETYDAAQKLYAQQRMSDGEIHVLQNIGIARALDLQDLKGAVVEFSRALALAESSANRREAALAHLFRGEAFYRMGRAADAEGDFTEALKEAREIGATEEQWTALNGVGRIARDRGESTEALSAFRDAIAIVESVRSGLGSSSLKAEFLANKRQVYDGAIELMLQSPSAKTGELFGMFEKARARNLQDSLGAATPSLSEVQARLKPGSMLLEYWMDPNRLGVLWITAHGSGFRSQALAAGSSDQLNAFAAALQRDGDGWREPSRQWAQTLLRGVPLANDLHQLLIVPDGVLAEIPFETLDAAAILRRFNVSYLPSAALLLRPTNTRRVLPWQTRLLAFGDPVTPQKSALPDDERWTPLPGSQRELSLIQQALPGKTQAHEAGDDRKQYLFASSVANTSLLHFSTHAAIDITDPGRSRILFTPEPGRPESQYLFRGEVQTLPLRNVDLVTLSACDTERGKITPGEGVQGFSRAFLGAGAASTVTTLWRAADGPSGDLMGEFYARLGTGESKAESLRAAKLRFLNSGNELAQPKYWAPFILTGDGQQPIPPATSWATLIVAGVALLAIIILCLRFPHFPRRLLDFLTARRHQRAAVERARAIY
ncbi:MAG TPA: CHAT domain-containing protein [Bryobacteraceae bacterium]|nr:CHAT domain-containing protein [Bryobacteraceae bacterium]